MGLALHLGTCDMFVNTSRSAGLAEETLYVISCDLFWLVRPAAGEAAGELLSCVRGSACLVGLKRRGRGFDAGKAIDCNFCNI